MSDSGVTVVRNWTLSRATDPAPLARRRFQVTGVVQGVGFRPFVYGLAVRLGLAGWVCNTSSGVVVEVEAAPAALDEFGRALRSEAPTLARIDSLSAAELAPAGLAGFEIRESQAEPGAFQPISPDIGLCPDCLRELFDPRDRRYSYPFINCTNCGPRFTIITDLPYDRPQTTMARFALCADCAREYDDPLDRRFHAQPVACPACGPRAWLQVNPRSSGASDMQAAVDGAPSAVEAARRLLRLGRIVAVKGLGGFHLACDATNERAVAELRWRKGRVEKPFALMLPDLAAVERYCQVSPAERALLEARERPIVLLQRRSLARPPIASSVAPGQPTLGVMLPYTPLHYLLVERARGFPPALVMTSGNYAEEPILTRNDEARACLSSLADAFLLHDRDIHIRADDSVVRVFEGCELPVRRSRGYAPYPVRLPCPAPPLLAVGAELKNTFCVARERYAFLSHHIGDLENLEALESFDQGVAHFEALFRIRPQALAYDLHPDYLATRYALRRAEREHLPAIGVQHHHAHVAACLAENDQPGASPVVGVAFDGAGYGLDGAVWGGEFLIADYVGFERAAHLAYVPLPGGDAAVRRTARMALAHLIAAGVPLTDDLPPVAELAQAGLTLPTVTRQVAAGLNAPATSSMGRLFDAVAAIIGVRQAVNYEGQAAIELEALADPGEAGAYRFDSSGAEIHAGPVIQAVVADYRAGVPGAVMAARFHNAVAAMVHVTCLRLRAERGLGRVALSGGVFQNVTLLARTLALLRASGFEVFTHRLVPPNDGGLALGQAAVAAHRLAAGNAGQPG